MSKSRFHEYLEKVIPEGTYEYGKTSKEIKTLPQGPAGSGVVQIEVKGNIIEVLEGGKTYNVPINDFASYTTPNGLKINDILIRNKINIQDYIKDQNPPIDFMINQNGQIIRKNPGT